MRRRWPHRVIVKSFTTAENAIGEEIKTFSQDRVVWANVKPISGSEVYLGDREVGLASHIVEMHYDPADALLVKDRIVFGTRNLDVLYIENVGERDRMIRALCQEQVGGS